jgi:hypothetical protein
MLGFFNIKYISMKFFVARCIRFQQQDQDCTLGFFDDEFDPIDYLLLARSDSTPADVSLLLNEDDREFGHAIAKIQLHHDDFWLWIKAEAQDAVDYAKIHIQIEQPDRALSAQLQQLCMGTQIDLLL